VSPSTGLAFNQRSNSVRVAGETGAPFSSVPMGSISQLPGFLWNLPRTSNRTARAVGLSPDKEFEQGSSLVRGLPTSDIEGGGC
jgi:hypothetical protein